MHGESSFTHIEHFLEVGCRDEHCLKSRLIEAVIYGRVSHTIVESNHSGLEHYGSKLCGVPLPAVL